MRCRAEPGPSEKFYVLYISVVDRVRSVNKMSVFEDFKRVANYLPIQPGLC